MREIWIDYINYQLMIINNKEKDDINSNTKLSELLPLTIPMLNIAYKNKKIKSEII